MPCRSCCGAGRRGTYAPRSASRSRIIRGATAHYLSEELDAGPIIEQDGCRVDHRHTVTDLRGAGRYVGRSIPARAVYWQVGDRVITTLCRRASPALADSGATAA
ncbi:formyltransferase family protein [Pseudofrankia sp. BMG5.37]